jgi:uncharacterized membrane protein
MPSMPANWFEWGGGMATTGAVEGGDDCRVIRPDFAVDWPQTVRIFIGMATVTLGIALGFAVMGYWPILPFAGLEVAALGVALYASARRSLDTQVLRLNADWLLIEKGRRRPEQRWQFQRAWAEVVLEPSAGSGVRVVIRSRGEAVEVGEFLAPEARRGLARELRSWIGPMGSAVPADE